MSTLNILLALHVLGVIWWIGGVFTVTTSLLPVYNRLPDGERIERIRAFEHRFANQARIAVLLVGVTGFWMYALVPDFIAHTWWVGLMMLVWALFTFMLFIAEPFGLPGKLGLLQSRRKFLLVHAVLLVLALVAVVGGVIGSRGGL